MKVQYKSEPLSIPSRRRHLLYRKDPSELSLWQRLFKNKWRYVYTAYSIVTKSDITINDCLKFQFIAKEAKDIIERCDTYEKLVQFLNGEYDKAKNQFNDFWAKYNQDDNWNF